MRGRTGAAAPTLAGALLTMLALAGCAGAGTGQVSQIEAAPGSAVPAAGASAGTGGPSADAAQSASAQVLAAYTGMRQAQEAAEASGTTQGSGLEAYATGKAFIDITASVIQEASVGREMIGIPLLHPRVTALDLNARPATATVTDCMDVSGWQSVDKATGKYVAVTSSSHNSFVSVSQAALGPNGWQITETEVNRSMPC